VDAFLDEVESELARLLQENKELRDGVPGGQVDGSAAAPAPTETIKVTTAAEASSAATRLLELATRNADELVGEARAEAEQILGEARTGAERIEAETKERAEQVESDARNRSQLLDTETEQRRRQLFGDLDRERAQLNGEVENLRAFEREYRARLKTYFEQQLAALDGSGEGGLLGDESTEQTA
jgi:cell division septum initiation protein DivIVA